MSARLDAVVVGCGRIGSGYDLDREGEPPLSHAGAYQAHDGTRLCAGVDPDPSARARFEARWGVPAYERLEDALDSIRPSLVSICTPPEERIEPLELTLQRGVEAIWIEKPLAASSDAGRAIVETADRADVPLQVNFHRRFDPAHRRVAELLGADPGPIHADMRFSGSLMNFGSHAFDLFRWLVGEPSRVTALALADREPLAFVETREGSTGTFCQVPIDGVTIFDADFLTSRRRVTLGAVGEQHLEAPVAESSLFRGALRHEYRTRHHDGIRGAMVAAVDSLVSAAAGESPLCEGRDGLASLRLVEAVVEAAESSSSVELVSA